MRIRAIKCAAVAALAVVAAGCGSDDASAPAPLPASTIKNATPPPPPAADADPAQPRTRYSLNNKCYALRSNATGQYVTVAGAGYAASAADLAEAEPFYLKPAALGSYLLYDDAGRLMRAAAPVGTTPLAGASDASVWTVKAVGDVTVYPAAPTYDVEPSKALIDAYRAFIAAPASADVLATDFRLLSGSVALAAGANGTLTTVTPSGAPAESFTFVSHTGCAAFPEAQSDVVGETFAGTTRDGRVLGMADVHVHIGSTTFLGGAMWGAPFHRFGVTHALGDCGADSDSEDPSTGAQPHGPQGSRDVIGAFLGNDFDGHATDGWPSFTDWPAAENLTHQAIYWRWLERAWKAGLRVAVNDLVENGTLCELERNNSNNPDTDCNEMNSAGRQAGTMYAMQDYLDAQYGGRGAGWLRIVLTPQEARDAIVAGKLALVLGIEISNFLDCQLTYSPNPARKEPFEEPLDATEADGENHYSCTPDSLVADLKRIHDWGVRQVISIHEFDNPFGGNGVFYPIINIGNRENTGGIPSGSDAGGFSTDPDSPTGEFWTTYECPLEQATPNFSGYLWDGSGGTPGRELRRSGAPSECNPNDDSQCLEPPPPPLCQYTGQGMRPGGTTPCYPDTNQCNARWMTPLGVFMYGKLMEMGFIFDFDHMELEMKTQALEYVEAQPIDYPIVSTHGTFGGTSNDQARRVLRGGGFLYPSLGNSAALRADMAEVVAIYDALPPAQKSLFGFGFGTDTNGLSGQAGTEPDVAYPFALFDGGLFDQLPDFAGLTAVTFAQPESGTRKWDIATDGSAQYGMLADMVQGMNLHGSPQEMQALFNSAERFLRTWQRTVEASSRIRSSPGGKAAVPPGLLRRAPTGSQVCTFRAPDGACEPAPAPDP